MTKVITLALIVGTILALTNQATAQTVEEQVVACLAERLGADIAPVVASGAIPLTEAEEAALGDCLVGSSLSAQQRVPPHVFVGAMINGAAAPDGTVIAAMVNDVEVATSTVEDGSWILIVDQGNESFAGMMVHFTVDGIEAVETPAWVQGGGTEITLSSRGATSSGSTVAAGVAGPAGPTGARGATGATGSQGRRGAAGAAGADGIDGARGANGAQGAAGPAGATGAAGGQGSEGPAGPPGIAGVAGDDGASALLGLVAVILAAIALVGAGGAFMVRSSKPGSETLLNEVQSLREQLGEAERIGGLRESLILAEYQAKAERWEEEGIDVAEVRRLINAYQANR